MNNYASDSLSTGAEYRQAFVEESIRMRVAAQVIALRATILAKNAFKVPYFKEEHELHSLYGPPRIHG